MVDPKAWEGADVTGEQKARLDWLNTAAQDLFDSIEPASEESGVKVGSTATLRFGEDSGHELMKTVKRFQTTGKEATAFYTSDVNDPYGQLQDGYDVFARSLGKANTYSGNPEESAYPDIGKRFGDLADELQAELTKAGEGPHDKGELIKKIAIAHRKLLKGKDLSTDEGAGNHPELKRLTPAMKKTIKLHNLILLGAETDRNPTMFAHNLLAIHQVAHGKPPEEVFGEDSMDRGSVLVAHKGSAATIKDLAKPPGQRKNLGTVYNTEPKPVPGKLDMSDPKILKLKEFFGQERDFSRYGGIVRKKVTVKDPAGGKKKIAVDGTTVSAHITRPDEGEATKMLSEPIEDLMKYAATQSKKPSTRKLAGEGNHKAVFERKFLRFFRPGSVALHKNDPGIGGGGGHDPMHIAPSHSAEETGGGGGAAPGEHDAMEVTHVAAAGGHTPTGMAAGQHSPGGMAHSAPSGEAAGGKAKRKKPATVRTRKYIPRAAKKPTPTPK